LEKVVKQSYWELGAVIRWEPRQFPPSSHRGPYEGQKATRGSSQGEIFS
jgi:hypothetical protein